MASLSGAAWLSFLDRTGHTTVFTYGRGQLLSELAYDPRLMTQLDSSAVEELFTIVRQWIHGHAAGAEIVATQSEIIVMLTLAYPWLLVLDPAAPVLAPPAASLSANEDRRGPAPFLDRLAALTDSIQRPAPSW